MMRVENRDRKGKRDGSTQRTRETADASAFFVEDYLLERERE